MQPDVPLHRLIAGAIMVAVALPVKLIIGRLFELSNDPAGYTDVWLKNIGVSKLFGAMDWYYTNPARKIRAWRRLLARFGGDPDLLLIELVRRPLALLWAVVTGRKRMEAVAEGDWEEVDDGGRAKELLAAHRRELRAQRGRKSGAHGARLSRRSFHAGASGRQSNALSSGVSGRRSIAATGVSGRHSTIPSGGVSGRRAIPPTGVSGRRSIAAAAGVSGRHALPPEAEAAAAGGGLRPTLRSVRHSVISALSPRSLAETMSDSEVDSREVPRKPAKSALSSTKSGRIAFQDEAPTGGRSSVDKPAPPPGEGGGGGGRKLEWVPSVVAAAEAAGLTAAQSSPPDAAPVDAGRGPATNDNVRQQSPEDSRGKRALLTKPSVDWGDLEVIADGGGAKSSAAMTTTPARTKSGRSSVAAPRTGSGPPSGRRSSLPTPGGGVSGRFAVAGGTASTKDSPPAGRRGISGRASVSGVAFIVQAPSRRSSGLASTGVSNKAIGASASRQSVSSSLLAVPLRRAAARRGGAGPLVVVNDAERLRDPKIDAAYEATADDARALRRKRWVALACVYISWAILAWFIFV